jgi:hypothetical protein
MDDLNNMIAVMIELYPDPHGSRPIANYPATMYAVTLTFHVSLGGSKRGVSVFVLTIPGT